MHDESQTQHHVVALAYDGLCTFEFGIAVEAFALERPEFDFPWYRFSLASPDPSPLRATGGFTLDVPGDLGAIADADTLVIPGWKGVDVEVPDDLCRAVKDAHGRGCRIISICSGAFVLAATGLLDGRAATTHWRYADHLATRYPRIRVKPDVLYEDAGNGIFTSAGSAAGLDLCLHLIRLDHGAAVANRVARRFVLPTQRQGGQVQFVDHVQPDPRSDISPLLEKLLLDLAAPLNVGRIAEMAGMSPRTLIRRFRQLTGFPPMEWVTRQRINHAMELLETSDASIDTIADACGFRAPETFRHHFRQQLGTSPSQYRKSLLLACAPS